jgi:hypothetical protein
VVTGQPGIGTSFLQKDLGYFAHALITCRQINILFYLLLRLLSNGEPVALQREDLFYLFTEDGVEMYNGMSTGWSFRFKGKIWALCDSDQVGIHPCPCPSFQRFSKEKHAYIVQTTSSADDRWIRWTNRCYATFFTMKCFTECEAKPLRSVIIANIPSILTDSFSQQNIGS